MFLLPFHVIGYSHELNDAESVGRLRISAERVMDAHRELERRGVSAVILSTCHRTELYWWGEHDLTEWFAHGLLRGMADSLRFERADADLAVRHLFAVAAGMKSARFGEPEILGQVRRAWVTARSAGTSRGHLDATFRMAIEAARHIRAAMGDDADPSLGERTRECIAAHATQFALHQPQILVVGSGDAARGALEALRHTPLAGARIAITSRTDARADAVGAMFHVPVVPWADHQRAIALADVVVFAVHVTTPLVGTSLLHMPVARERGRVAPALWVDLGVPGAVRNEGESADVVLTTMAHLEARSTAAEQDLRQLRSVRHEGRIRRAMGALQQELARYARATHRQTLGARLESIEAQAIAVASEHGDQPMDEVARRVTRLVLRELSRH